MCAYSALAGSACPACKRFQCFLGNLLVPDQELVPALVYTTFGIQRAHRTSSAITTARYAKSWDCLGIKCTGGSTIMCKSGARRISIGNVSQRRGITVSASVQSLLCQASRHSIICKQSLPWPRCWYAGRLSTRSAAVNWLDDLVLALQHAVSISSGFCDDA